MQPHEYDLIGYKIISPFHLAALKAYASRFKPTKLSLNVLLVTSKGPWQDKILSHTPSTDSRLKQTPFHEDEFVYEESRLWPLLLLLKPIAILLGQVTGRKQVPVCSPTMTCLKFSAASIRNTFLLRPIVIDEGIGSFNSTLLLRREAEQMTSSPISRALLFRCFQFMWSNLSLFGGSRVSLFSFKKGTPKINEVVAESYRNTFRNGYIERCEPVAIEANTILILTQPLVETGVCTATELVNTIRPWIEHAKALGATPALKLHPAEAASNYDSLGLKPVEYSGPVEELFAAKGENFREVWGFNSTSLITGRALFGISTKRMDPPWQELSITIFQGNALELFLSFTELIRLRQCDKPPAEL